MEKQKQELLKLIENLDLDKLQRNCDDSEWSPKLNAYGNIVSILRHHQKETAIEQKLEDLGFIETDYIHLRMGLIYQPSSEYINISFMPGSSMHFNAQFKRSDTKKILSFANYLVSIKNGVN